MLCQEVNNLSLKVSAQKKMCFFTRFSTNCFVDLEISENLKGLVLSSVIFGGSYPQYSV